MKSFGSWVSYPWQFFVTSWTLWKAKWPGPTIGDQMVTLNHQMVTLNHQMVTLNHQHPPTSLEAWLLHLHDRLQEEWRNFASQEAHTWTAKKTTRVNHQLMKLSLNQPQQKQTQLIFKDDDVVFIKIESFYLSWRISFRSFAAKIFLSFN